MNCPECKDGKMKVIRVRQADREVLRIRSCTTCEARYLSEEKCLYVKRYL